MADWSRTSLQLKLIKIGARVVRHARAITFQLAEVAVTGPMVRALSERAAPMPHPILPHTKGLRDPHAGPVLERQQQRTRPIRRRPIRAPRQNPQRRRLPLRRHYRG
jgi:hypothetical protein